MPQVKWTTPRTFLVGRGIACRPDPKFTVSIPSFTPYRGLECSEGMERRELSFYYFFLLIEYKPFANEYSVGKVKIKHLRLGSHVLSLQGFVSGLAASAVSGSARRLVAWSLSWHNFFC